MSKDDKGLPPVELQKITQDVLSNLLHNIPPDSLDRDGRLEVENLLAKKGFANDLSGLNVDFTGVGTNIVDFSGVILRSSRLSLGRNVGSTARQKIDFTNSDLTNATVIGGEIGGMNFGSTIMSKTVFRASATPNRVVDLVVDQPFKQKALLEKYPNLLTNQGVCFGLGIAIALHFDKYQKQGKVFNIARKLNKQLDNTQGTKNFLYRVQLYNNIQQATAKDAIIHNDITEDYNRNNKLFLPSLSPDLQNSKILGLSFNVFNEEGRKVGLHAIQIMKIDTPDAGVKYQTMDANLGITHFDDAEAMSRQVEAIIYRYQKYADPSADNDIKVWDIEKTLKNLNLVPDDAFTKEENKDRKYHPKIKSDMTHLMMAILYKSPVGFIEKLIEGGEDVNYRKDESIPTFLMLAVDQGRGDVVECLVKAGADVNAKLDDEGTALLRAVQRGNKEIVNALLKAGADVNDSDSYGNTVLMAALRKKDVDIVNALVQAGADTTAKNRVGLNIGLMVRTSESPEIESIIAEAERKKANLKTQAEVRGGQTMLGAIKDIRDGLRGLNDLDLNRSNALLQKPFVAKGPSR
jgi:ankyrin repeat protein